MIIILSLIALPFTGCVQKVKESKKGVYDDIYIKDVQGEDSLGDSSGVLSTNEDEDDSDSNEPTLAEILPKCGINDFSDENEIRFSQEITYDFVRTVQAGYFDVNVEITAKIILSNIKAGLTFQVEVEPTNVSVTDPAFVGNDLGPAQVQAEADVLPFKGDVVSESIAANSNFTKEWKGIVCTIPGAQRLETTREGFTTVVEFTPGYPPAISPIADADRYEAELGEIRYFPGIEAKVIATDNPRLQVGQVVMGSVIIEKIPTTKSSPDGLQTVSSDSAYRVTNYFGTRQQTLDLGFHLWNEYYIDHTKKAFTGVFADVGGPNNQYFVAEPESP